MHIPDGLLSLEISAVFWVISLIIFSLALRDNRKKISRNQIAVILALTLIIFVAQMSDFPVLGGTTGHILGGALLAILLGFSPAVIIMSAILVIQAVVFHDGGVIALGANVFSMAIIAPLIGVGAKKLLNKNLLLAGITAGFVSVFVAAAVTSLMIVFSGGNPLTVLSGMLTAHIFLGIVEGLVTGGFVFYSLHLAKVVVLNKAEA
ncbi:MAG: energy-coupling factor ABC transporter permease [Candidatus Diapherotrites archaeon]